MRRQCLFESNIAKKVPIIKTNQQNSSKNNKQLAIRWALVVKKIFKQRLGIKVGQKQTKIEINKNFINKFRWSRVVRKIIHMQAGVNAFSQSTTEKKVDK
jgi:hypothetical protein